MIFVICFMNILYFEKGKSLLNLLLIKLYCLLQGRYENDDVGQFRFEILLPNLDKRGKYYKTENMLIACKETLYIATHYFEWPFLKNSVEQKF